MLASEHRTQHPSASVSLQDKKTYKHESREGSPHPKCKNVKNHTPRHELLANATLICHTFFLLCDWSVCTNRLVRMHMRLNDVLRCAVWRTTGSDIFSKQHWPTRHLFFVWQKQSLLHWPVSAMFAQHGVTQIPERSKKKQWQLSPISDCGIAMLVHTRRGACTNKGCRCLQFLYPLPAGLPLCVTIKVISLCRWVVLQPVVKYWCFSLLGFALAPVRFGIRSLFA